MAVGNQREQINGGSDKGHSHRQIVASHTCATAAAVNVRPAGISDWVNGGSRVSGESISLLHDVNNYPSDHVEHIGIVEGDHFAGRTESWTGAFPCAEQRWEDYRFEAHVSGRFSSDGRALIGREVWSYTLTTGETVNFQLDWTATRQ